MEFFYVAISKFKLDDNRNIEDEVKFGTGIKYGRNERISSSAGWGDWPSKRKSSVAISKNERAKK